MADETVISLKITDQQVQQAVSAQLARLVTPDVQRDAIAQAIKYLVTPKRSGYGPDKSPLAVAYEAAINEHIREWAREYVAKDDAFREAVNAALAKATKALVANSIVFEGAVTKAAVRAATDLEWRQL